ncbi:type I-F CRISPR-associated endoribonuclease Cas6/Csy4 [Marinobacterium rhizophilum]|uniref:type I-F CRISPR-associated endoribonuclease Cas6/Csy4 n=1 Tax=Marinobacterium rhizophilum TaxID=420402 RepID=UPI00037E9655|nr:type I-F CRISPR-associated endoribonuclease Cas6/Csy4 [Marinobacterium rhizophilum]
MDYYIDIHLRPDPEFGASLLLGALFNKLHRALVELESNHIGISFPAHATRPRTMGDHVRIHGREGALQGLMDMNWLKGMRDHVSVGGVSVIPDQHHYRVVRRVQPKSNADRIRRRYMKRHQVSAEQAQETIPDTVVKPVEQPYVSIRSQSTGQAFCLFIEHLPLQEKPVKGDFSSYGLSATATIPWF